MDGSTLAAIIGAAVPVAGAIIGGFWGLSNKIHTEVGGVKQDIGEIKGDIKAINTKIKDFSNRCDDRHKEVDRRLDKLENKHD